MKEDLSGLRAIVTGAGQGIGFAIARALLERGARLTFCDVSESRVAAAMAELRSTGDVQGFACDVSQSREVKGFIDASAAVLGGIDLLVSNAGIMPEAPFLTMREDEWDAVMDVNAKGTFLICQAVAQHMVRVAAQRPRQIITISSGSHRFGRIGSAHYCASKAAVVMLTRTMAMELAREGILVNCIAPGLIENPTLTDDYRAAFCRTVPLGRIGQPEDIAQAVVMLAAQAPSYLTGQVISVDGGVTAGRFGLPLSHQDASR